ncbi:hypothetical protein C8R45DRAFT_1022562, partial [Mycena sanguinolenta]
MCVLHSLHSFHFRFLFCTTYLSVALTAFFSPLRAYAAFVAGRDGVSSCERWFCFLAMRLFCLRAMRRRVALQRTRFCD